MKQTILTVFLLVTISFSCVVQAARNAGLSSAITENELKEINNLVLSTKDWAKDIHNAFYVSSVLGSETPNKAEIGILAKNTLKSKDQSLETIYHAAGVVENLKVEGVTVDKSVVDTIRNAIEEGDSLVNYFYAGSAALALRKQVKDITEDELTTLVGKVAELGDEDGTFFSSPADKEGSLYNTGLALQLIARLAKETKLSEEDKEHLDSLVEKAESVVSLGNEEDGTLEFSAESVGALATTSAVLSGLNALAAATKKALPEVTPVHINQIVQYLVNHKSVGTVADAYHLLSALRSLEGSQVAAPLVVSLDRASILGTAKGAEGHLGVKVTDVFGKPVPGVKVYLTKAHPVGKDSHVLLSNHELNLAEDKKSFTLNFLGAKPDQGFYTLEYRVVPPAGSKYAAVESAVRTVKVVGSIVITDLEVVVADSKDALNKPSEGNRYKVADMKQKIDETVHIDHTQVVNVKFRVRNAVGSNKPVTVQQAFVKFTHIKSGNEAIFIAQPNENKQYSVLIDLTEASKSQFKSHSGEYKLEIIAGDAYIQNPIHWVVSTSVKLALESAAAAAAVKGLGPLPEIHHQFRTAEKRPPAVVSSVFTLAVLAPLLFLFIGFITVGANISAFPTGADFLSAVGFIGSIGATLALIAFYWLKLNLVQTLGYLAVLAVPTVFFGQRALSSISRRKLA